MSITETPAPTERRAAPTKERYCELLDSGRFDGQLRGSLHGYTVARLKRRAIYNAGSYGIVVRLNSSLSTPIAAKMHYNLNFSDVQHRYREISRHLHESPKMPHLLLKPVLHDEGLSIDGQLVPVVETPWIEGLTLNLILNERPVVQSRYRLFAAELLLGMMELEKAKVSHGDLCTRNVMITDQGLKLVDYDNMYVPALCGLKHVSPTSSYDKQAQTQSFNETADRYNAIRLFAALLVIGNTSRDFWEKYRLEDWLLDLDCILDATLQLKKDMRELLNTCIRKGSSGEQPLSLFDLMTHISFLRSNVEHIVTYSGRKDLTEMWHALSKTWKSKLIDPASTLREQRVQSIGRVDRQNGARGTGTQVRSKTVRAASKRWWPVVSVVIIGVLVVVVGVLVFVSATASLEVSQRRFGQDAQQPVQTLVSIEGWRYWGRLLTLLVRTPQEAPPTAPSSSSDPVGGTEAPSDPLAGRQSGLRPVVELTPPSRGFDEETVEEAKVQYASGNYEEALAIAERVVEQGSSHASEIAAMSACKLGDMERATRYAVRLRGSAMTRFRRACAQEPSVTSAQPTKTPGDPASQEGKAQEAP